MKVKRILAVILTAAMLLSCMSFTAFAAESDPLVIGDEVYTLENVSITATEGPAITIAEGANVTLTIVGDNYVYGGRGSAGIYVPVGSTLTIVGDGTLTAVGGDAATLVKYTSENDELPGDYSTNLRGYWSAGAGIGGNGSHYLRNKYEQWGVWGAEGTLYQEGQYYYLLKNNANFGTININMTGTINATGGDAVSNEGGGAGIGSGGCNPTVLYDSATDEYAPLEGAIVIESGNITAIGGSTDNAMSSNSGAGIGAGCCSQAVVGNNIDITITGGTINATGAMDAAAIGGGAHVQGGDITITGGTVTAVSGVESDTSGNGAGIGAGHMAYEGIITINGNSVVTAKANGNAAGIGAGADTYVGSETTDELHCENVVFGGTADISFDGGKTTFFTIEEGSNPTLTSESAVCAVVNDQGVTIGLAASFEEAVSVINEFDNVTTLRLIKDTTVDETVVVEDNITIDGDGYTLKGADVENPETWDATGVTPIKVVDGAVVNLTNITVKGGSVVNTADYANDNSYGIAGEAVIVDNATLNVYDSKLLGGDTGAMWTRSNGQAIVTTNSTIYVENSTLANGRATRENVISWSVIETDEDSDITLKDVTLDSEIVEGAYAGYSAPIISKIVDNQDEVRENPVYMSGTITVPGYEIEYVNIVVPEGEDIRFVGNIGAEYISDRLDVEFVPVKQSDEEDEVSDLYDIVIVGNAKFINRLSTADFVFDFDSTPASEAAMKYEIIAVNPVTVTPDYNVENRYMFNFDGVTQPDETSKRITIGQVKVSGYGEYSLTVDSSADNLVTTAATIDNIVEYFYVGGSADGNFELNLGNGATGKEIEIPTRNLVINVAYPNAISANDKAYQQMTVTVTGPDNYKEVLYLAAGNEDADTYNLRTADNGVVYYSTDDPTTDLVEGLALVLNTPYTVTVEGLGYRTAKYTVSMTEDKTLNFWNNVMDNDTYVEVAESGNKNAQKVTFLAGDIVKDNNINVYDLSAVVSYFGEIDLAEKGMNTYAKYDLNRDGKIDSKDVAYVLVSWGN